MRVRGVTEFESVTARVRMRVGVIGRPRVGGRVRVRVKVGLRARTRVRVRVSA